MVVICEKPYENAEYNEYFNNYPFELSDFQKYAIEAIVTGNHSLVTAHTGSGKTLPGEFAIEHFVKKGKKVVYTSPIKALSNQKYYEFTKKFPDISIGLFTGDIKTNPCASVLIMTTEILMNYLFTLDTNNEFIDERNYDFQLNIKDELACVIFDEVHYINDLDRGQNWEQTILMLPKEVQMVMLSATIDSPEKFAKWCEKDNEKQVYLSSTYKRVVPLTHYGFLTTNETIYKKIRDKETQQKIRNQTNKFHILKTSNDKYMEDGYLQLKSTMNYFHKENLFVNKTHVLNQLAKQLKEEEKLPAIAFVFSRKNVETFANAITTNILEFDSKVPYTIKNECDSIIKKLPNYQEYMRLPEYDGLIKLLEKGIGIHHSGMIPILREIVETMISRKHIKLLFATESFAIGLDCPIRTAVFTSLTKFDGTRMRYLFPHEYSQAAGRAGRRGLDTIGNVIHCNNMFDLPSSNEYREILCGAPQKLVSKFNISFSTILNLMRNGKTQMKDFTDFVENSMLKQELSKTIENEKKTFEDLSEKKTKKEEIIKNMRSNKEECMRFIEINDSMQMYNSKKKKEVTRELENIKNNNKFLNQDIELLKEYREITKDLNYSEGYIEYSENFIYTKTNNMCELLINQDFIKKNEEDYELTELGNNACLMAEIHPLVFVDFLEKTDYMENYDSIEIIGILSIYTDIRVKEDERISIPMTEKLNVKNAIKMLIEENEKYLDMEERFDVNSGYNYDDSLIFDVVDLVMEWSNLESEEQCKYFIQTKLNVLEISLGDFIKALLKISTINKELIKLSIESKKPNLESKLSKIDGYILKFVATTQSLYV